MGYRLTATSAWAVANVVSESEEIDDLSAAEKAFVNGQELPVSGPQQRHKRNRNRPSADQTAHNEP